METFVSGMIGNLGNHRGCRGGYGFLRKPILYSALRARAVGLHKCCPGLYAGGDSTISTCPCIPGPARACTSARGAQCIPGPAREGEKRSALSGRFIFPLYLKSSENHISISPDPYPAGRFCLHLYKKFYTIKMKKEAHHGQLSDQALGRFDHSG